MKIIIWKKDRIDYIVNGICGFYNIKQNELFRYYRSAQKTKRKKFAVKLLREVADCSFEEIAQISKNISRSGICQSYNAFNDDISLNSYGNKELKKEYLEILDYLKL